MLLDGRLYQWDIDRKIRIVADNDLNITEVHYYHEGETEGYRVKTVVVNGTVMAPIPNVLLQENKTIEIYVMTETDNGTRTRKVETARVFARSKPPNYIYTDDDVYTVEKVVEKALLEAKESGEFNGKDGYTPRKGVDYCTEEDKDQIRDYINTTLAETPDFVRRVYSSSQYPRVYGISEDGQRSSVIEYTSGTVKGTLMYRDSAGRSKVADPVSANDITNKRYVDEKIGDIENALDSIIAIQDSLLGGAE